MHYLRVGDKSFSCTAPSPIALALLVTAAITTRGWGVLSPLASPKLTLINGRDGVHVCFIHRCMRLGENWFSCVHYSDLCLWTAASTPRCNELTCLFWPSYRFASRPLRAQAYGNAKLTNIFISSGIAGKLALYTVCQTCQTWLIAVFRRVTFYTWSFSSEKQNAYCSLQTAAFGNWRDFTKVTSNRTH